jgi:expansin
MTPPPLPGARNTASSLSALLCASAVLLTLSACGGGDGNSPAASDPTATTATPTASTGNADLQAAAGSKTAAAAERSGVATWYAATGAGACSYDASDDRLVAAMNTPDWAGSAVCGMQVTVDGPSGSVSVRIVDRCPECVSGQLDLSREAFERIAPLSEGRVPIRWRAAEAPVSGPLGYRVKEGSNPNWVALQVRNHRWPVARVEIQTAGASGWTALPRTDYNYFVHDGAALAAPLRLRTTAEDGQQLVDTLSSLQAGAINTGAAQFQ